jgi:hypothetical protein
MYRVLWVTNGFWERKGKLYVYFRATGTKAAPGKRRELRPKWKNLSWVLQNLFHGFLRCSGQKAICKPKGQNDYNSALL